jgi:DnaJ-class molecular chaperone
MDYYQILGVAPDATQEDIKKAWRTIARNTHSDIHGDDPERAARFADAKKAHEVLSDERKRQQYDLGRNPVSLENLLRTDEGALFLQSQLPSAPSAPKPGAPLLMTLPVEDGVVTLPTPEGVTVLTSERHPLLRVPGHGQQGRNGGADGDLFIIPSMETT